MKFSKYAAMFALFLCFLMAPMGQSSVALSSGSGLLDGFTPFPVPNNKPYQCQEQEELSHEAYLNKKQAAAAALGLYFGVRHANAPQLKKEQMIEYICL